jgi:hypothetical protein
LKNESFLPPQSCLWLDEAKSIIFLCKNLF